MRAAVTVNEVKSLHFLIRARSTLSCNPINVFCAHILSLTFHLHKTEMDTLQGQDFSLYRFYIIKFCLLGKNATYFYITFDSLRHEI